MIDLDSGKTPDQVIDSNFSLNPYDLPARIWGLIENKFKQYGVSIVEAYPQARVNGNTVSWRIVTRRAGGANGRKQKMGPMLSSFYKLDTDGVIYVVYAQDHIVDFEFAIFSTSNAEADKIAWDLERFIVLCEGPLKQFDPGITLTFTHQTADMNMRDSHQDDIIARYIRFTATVPVREIRTETELRSINLTIGFGDKFIQSPWYTRTDSSSKYYIPISLGTKITKISSVYKFTGVLKLLKQDTDYYIKQDSSNLLYIEWNDVNGAVPGIGDQFRVEYHITGIVHGTNISDNDLLRR